MFEFFSKLTRRGIFGHNKVDPAVLGRFIGHQVVRGSFSLEEDTLRHLVDGLTWRRRRFRFDYLDDKGARHADALCFNELTLDSNAQAQILPELAADYPDLCDIDEVERAYRHTVAARGAIRADDGNRDPRLFLNVTTLHFGASDEDTRQAVFRLRTTTTPYKSVEQLSNDFELLDPELMSQGKGGPLDLVRWLPAFPMSRLVQSSGDILAATNAGYFLNFPEEYSDGVSALHQPLGGHVIRGKLVVPTWIGRPGIMKFTNGKVVSRIFGPEDMELVIDGLPPVPLKVGNFSDAPQGMVWRVYAGEELSPPIDAAQLSFTGTLLVSCEAARSDAKPPHGGAIIWLMGEHAKAALLPSSWKKISLRLRPQPEGEVDWLLSAGPFLVRDSRAVPGAAMFEHEYAGEFRPAGPAPTRFPFDADETRAPRTAIGTTSSGGWKIVVVDGRQPGEHSMGLTLEGLAHLMQWVGCETAMNLDGGGSSAMAIEGMSHAESLRETVALNVVNIPSDAGNKERIVPIFVVVRTHGS